jgi:hypothetical protein
MPLSELLIVNYASNILLILIRTITDWPSMHVVNNNYEDVFFYEGFLYPFTFKRYLSHYNNKSVFQWSGDNYQENALTYYFK